MRTADALLPGPGQRALRGLALAYVLVLVAIPLATLVVLAFADGPAVFVERVTDEVARDALVLTLGTGVLVGALNVLFGTATAWVLTRYRFPGRGALSALVDLPLAVPTLVAGVMIAVLYGPSSLVGTTFAAWDVEIVFAKPGIVLALLFVTLPFVVRAVEPVLAEIDVAEEEAAIKKLRSSSARARGACSVRCSFPRSCRPRSPLASARPDARSESSDPSWSSPATSPSRR